MGCSEEKLCKHFDVLCVGSEYPQLGKLASTSKRPIVLPTAYLNNYLPGGPLLSSPCVENWLRYSGPELSRFYLLESPPFMHWAC